ncbi:MAG TPA: tetratricopeptide repeat protein [Saprospiraceae bacterium]|nr:tetratricopeptide repeat protein [Saprospiraceae bacterium]
MAKSKKQLKKTGKSKDTRGKANSNKLDGQDWKYVGISLLLTLIAFLTTIGNQFVNWDDDYNVANNTNTALLSWDNIVKIFSEHVIGNYNPLPILTFTIERSLVGLSPALYHIDNLILHLVCVFFVYRIFRGLGLNGIASAAGAILFGIHPMRVESVAWVTERKDVLFGAFFLSALWYYILYVKSGYAKKYFYAAMGLFVFALFSKIQSVSLPLTMLLVDYYYKRPLNFKLVLEKWAFFLLALIIGLVGFYFLGKQGSINDKTNYSIIERLMVGGYSLGVYLVKFIFPYRMSPLYPYPAKLPVDIYFGPVVGIGILAFIYIAYKKDWRPYVFGVLFFIVNVMFVLQIVGAGQGYLADRFTYIPYAGLIFMVAYAGQWLYNNNQAAAKPAMYGFGAVILLFMFMTFRQTKIWHDSDKLWTHVMKYYTDTPLPFRNRANYRRDEGRIQEALSDYDAAIRLKPDGALYNSRAKLYFNLQKYQEAMDDYNRAIKSDSTQGEYFVNRGAVYALSGQLQQALNDFTKGLELDPKHANGYKNRSLVYQSFSQWDKALNDINIYLGMHPEDADLWYESGRLKNIINQPAAAITDLDRAIQLNSKQGLYYYEKLKSYLSLGQKAQAQQLYTVVTQYGIKLEPEVQAALSK